jgi:hypothetical protein
MDVYKHTRLDSLKLFSCSFVEFEQVNFHSLKEVFLGWIEVTFSALNALLTNCKVIESLNLKRFWSLIDNFSVEEQNTTLKKLVVDKCHLQCRIFNIHAPNLKYFSYCGLMNIDVMLVNAVEIEEVDLDFSNEFGFEGHGPFIYSMLVHLSNIRVLFPSGIYFPSPLISLKLNCFFMIHG